MKPVSDAGITLAGAITPSMSPLPVLYPRNLIVSYTLTITLQK
jgi:hypothetical protein